MYDDVNAELKDAEPVNQDKGDEEMTHAKNVNVKHDEVSQEVAGDQVKDDAQETVTASPATQKTKDLIQISNLEKEVRELKNVDHSSALCATIKFEFLTAIKEYIGTSLDDALYKQVKPQNSAEDIRKVKMEHATIQQETKYTITSSDTAELQEFNQKRCLFETMTKTKSFNKNAKHKARYHALIESIFEDEDAIDKGVADKSKKRKPDDADSPTRPDQRLKRKKTDKETKPSKKSKSIVTSKGATKSQPKSIGKSAQAEETLFEDGDTQVPQNHREDTDNTDEPPVVNVNPKDWFKKPERPPTLDPEWNECKTVDNKPTQKWLNDLAKAKKPSKTLNDLMSTLIDFSAFVMNHLQISDLTQDILVRPAYNILKGTCRSYIKLEYNMEECYKALTDQLDWNNPEGDRYPFDLSKPNRLFNLKGEDIVHLAAALCMFTRHSVIQKRMKDLQLGVESYQKKLNISTPRTREEDFFQRAPYTTVSDPQGVIYEDKLNRKRLMRSDELYKFNDGTLQSVRDTLHDMLPIYG
uniref:Uncharacterized protein n=1 Tax=Tanacetum cinerariifolium TaxID=118510 RepID=A0A699HXL8_TANCI|nr:hypothetical protein [Tanacetum cinerariifolium]